jgi:hypothetical protein
MVVPPILSTSVSVPSEKNKLSTLFTKEIKKEYFIFFPGFFAGFSRTIPSIPFIL